MEFVPMYIKETQTELPRSLVDHVKWNSLWNRIILQGDNNSEALHRILNNREVNLGHVIVKPDGSPVEPTKYLKFLNTVITVDGEFTTVTGVPGPKGDKGEPGVPGPQGPQGDMGTGFIVLGSYSSLIELEQGVPSPSYGDSYLVGIEYPLNCYVYVGDWVNMGPIQGPQGPQGPIGPVGPEGPQGPVGPMPDMSSYNSHMADSVAHITAGERIAWNAKSSLALGETSSTAYRGDRGKIAYDHSQSAHQPVITGAATTAVSSNFAGNRVVISNSSGKLEASAITTTLLDYLSGLNSNIQNQLNGKLGSSAVAADSQKVNGKRITVSSSAPSSPSSGDVWIQI